MATTPSTTPEGYIVCLDCANAWPAAAADRCTLCGSKWGLVEHPDAASAREQQRRIIADRRRGDRS